MIVMKENGIRFKYRVAGVALDAGRVLVHRAETDDFWALPGGRVELLELAQDALAREMHEELKIDVRVERLLWVAEYLFNYEGDRNHELGLYFLMTLPEGSWPGLDGPFLGDEEGTRLIFQWFPLAQLESLPLYPTFLRKKLQAIPQVVEHIVHHDDSYMVLSR